MAPASLATGNIFSSSRAVLLLTIAGLMPALGRYYPGQTDNSGLYGGLGGGGATCFFVIIIILWCCRMGIICNQTSTQAPAAAPAAPVPDALLSPAAATVVQQDSIIYVPDIVVVKGEALPSSSKVSTDFSSSSTFLAKI